MKAAYFDASWDVMMAGWQSRPMSSLASTLPADASVLYLALNHEQRMTRVFYTSETLAEVPEGGAIPCVEPVLTTHWPEREA